MMSSVKQDMTAKEYLRQYAYAQRRADIFREEYEAETLKVDAIRSLSDNDGMPHGTNISKPTEDKAIRLADKAKKWRDAELDALEVRQMVFDTISIVPDIEGKVLYERYIQMRKWEEICVRLNYSWKGIHLVHRRALNIVESIINPT